MTFDITKMSEALGQGLKDVGESVGEGVQSIGDTIEQATASFHENFVSKVIPEAGTFGEVGIFVAEMLPGVSEYNAIREGDWERLATDIAIGAAIGVGVTALSVGVGIAGASVIGAVGIKAVGEIGEAVSEKVIKEGMESAGKRLTKEGGETLSKKIDNVLTDGTHLENGRLKPDVTYKSGEHDYVYKTDSSGRIAGVEAQTLQLKQHEGRLSHNPNTLDKLEGDDAGHLIADRFGGSAELDNLISQSAKINRGEYSAIENELSRAVTDGKKVSLGIDLEYADYSNRPNAFNITYEIDGIPNFKRITQ